MNQYAAEVGADARLTRSMRPLNSFLVRGTDGASAAVNHRYRCRPETGCFRTRAPTGPVELRQLATAGLIAQHYQGQQARIFTLRPHCGRRWKQRRTTSLQPVSTRETPASRDANLGTRGRTVTGLLEQHGIRHIALLRRCRSPPGGRLLGCTPPSTGDAAKGNNGDFDISSPAAAPIGSASGQKRAGRRKARVQPRSVYERQRYFYQYRRHKQGVVNKSACRGRRLQHTALRMSGDGISSRPATDVFKIVASRGRDQRGVHLRRRQAAATR